MAKCQPIGLGPEKTDGGEFTAVFKMTESQLLIATKYPDHKGFTREEYEAATDDYMARKSRSLAKEKGTLYRQFSSTRCAYVITG